MKNSIGKNLHFLLQKFKICDAYFTLHKLKILLIKLFTIHINLSIFICSRGRNSSKRRRSFSRYFKSTMKNSNNSSKRKTAPRKFSLAENRSSGSTKCSTIFGIRELNMIYRQNSLDKLTERESVCTEDSVVLPSRERVSFYNGLQRLNLLFQKKHFAHRIEAFYRLWSNYSENSINVNHQKLEKYLQSNDSTLHQIFESGAKTSRNNRKSRRSVALGFEIYERSGLDDSKKFDNSDLKSLFKNNMSVLSESEFNNTKSRYRIKSIKWTTKSEYGDYEEEEEVFLCSSINQSDHDEHSFSVDIEPFVIYDEPNPNINESPESYVFFIC